MADTAELAWIEPSIRHLAVEIGSIVPDPANVRKHPQRNLETIRGSLAGFGQQKPIVVDGNGVCVAGNGTLEAAKALGWSHVAAVRTSLTGAQARAFAIADNRTAELAEWDLLPLSEMLASLQNDESIDHLLTGYTDLDIERIVSDAAGIKVEDPASEWTGMPSYQNDNQDGIIVHVHFASEADRAKFFEVLEVSFTDKTNSFWYPKRPDVLTDQRGRTVAYES